MLGKALSEVARSEVQIVTKGGIGPNIVPDGRPDFVRKSIEQSLKRLGTDYVDLFNLARIDTKVPIEETMATLKSMVDEGEFAFFNYSHSICRFFVTFVCRKNPSHWFE